MARRPAGQAGPLALVLAVALVTGACRSDGDGPADNGSAAGDPIGEVSATGERPVQVTGAGNVRLSGTLLVPEAAAKATVPGVLLVPPSGPGDRNGPLSPGGVPDRIYQDLSKAMADGGMASFRYDRRGMGESKLEPDARFSFDDLVADAKAGIDFLAQRKETAGSDLAVVGHDDGGLVALRLAASDSRIKRVVLISTPGRPLVEAQADVLTTQYGPESGDALRAEVAKLVADGTVAPVDQLRSELRGLLPSRDAPFLRQLYSIDPAAEAARVKVPVLIVVGGSSSGVSRVDAERLGQALGHLAEVTVRDNVGPSLLTVRSPAGDDPSDPASITHQHGAGPPNTGGQRDAAAVGRITSWLSNALGSRRPG